MEQNILQLGLAIAPAIAVSLILKRITLPWEKKKSLSERAEILSMLAQDIKKAKSIMARGLLSVNSNQSIRIPLSHWRQLKYDQRLRKYADEKIFKLMIKQFKEWERI